MAVDSETVIHSDAPASDAGAAATVMKKQRKPRTKKVVPVANTSPVSEPAAPAIATPAKRGRPAKVQNTEASVRTGTAKSKPVKKASETTAPVAAIDEMADLLQLEEENKKLRKLLAEKLRAENAELRKRLNLA